MREIKFREWTGDMMESFILDKDFDCISGSFGEKPLMQFTGLTDKNGKEIYEGDMLKFTTRLKYGHFKEGVECITKPVEFGKFNPTNNTIYDFIGFHIDNQSIEYKLRYGCIVIGNIHENSELLK